MELFIPEFRILGLYIKIEFRQMNKQTTGFKSLSELLNFNGDFEEFNYRVKLSDTIIAKIDDSNRLEYTQFLPLASNFPTTDFG